MSMCVFVKGMEERERESEKERVTRRDVSVGGGPVCSYAILPGEEELFGSVYFNT